MQESYQMTERLIAEFTENYLERLFYFCLKRTGSSSEAEDLASDITLNIITALDRGQVPEKFPAWVWQIARNRYSVWAETKRRHRESAAGNDIGDYEIICHEFSAEENLIHREELSLLRRELSFISSDYRDIVVAYYIEDRKIRDIAASANLSEGAVKLKLFRARKKLKEGMSMAREFGTKSFKPEKVKFTSSGSQPSGLPWSVLGRKLPTNILLEASNNPSTIEELSVELGTAVPYMEEEVERLVKATLLKKIGDKYITDFFIVDRESEMAIYNVMRRFSKERSEMLDIIASDSLAQIRGLGIVRNDMSDNDLKWWALIYLTQYCVTHAKSYNDCWPVKRANNEEWGVLGYEMVMLPENCGMGHGGWGDAENIFWTYSVTDYGMWNRDEEMEGGDVLFLADVIRNDRKLSSFSGSEMTHWHNIENRFAHADSEGSIIPDILVIYSDDREKIKEIWREHPLYEKVMENIENAFDETIKILRQNNNPVLHDQLPYCASMKMLDCRMMTVHDVVNSGKLIPPEDPYHSRVAMWMELGRHTNNAR